MIINVSLSKLQLSDRNVRKTNRDEDIASLAEDIASRGLKQNLVATETERKGYYDVDAGGRRLQALQLLADAKRIPKNHPVPIMVEAREQALETSLAENLHRVAMNPADEFDAFALIIAGYAEGGITDRTEQIASCARRFGVTVRHVEQRLRLADLAPEILDALRAGTIGMESAKAYAAYPDRDLQLKVFKAEEKRTWGTKHDAKAVRDAMKGKVLRLSDRAAIYVGVDAYIAAGGRVARELFMSADDEDVLLDPKILKELYVAKCAIEAPKIAHEAGYFDGAVQTWNGSYEQWPPTPPGYALKYNGVAALTDEQRRDAIAIFTMPGDGSGPQIMGHCFVQAIPAADRTEHRAQSPEEREAAHRERLVSIKAARLATPAFAGTAFEGRAFWPSYQPRLVEPADEEGFVLVAVQIKVSDVDVNAMLAEAEQLVANELDAEKAAEQAEGHDVRDAPDASADADADLVAA